jgi:hypothetical protein
MSQAMHGQVVKLAGVCNRPASTRRRNPNQTKQRRTSQNPKLVVKTSMKKAGGTTALNTPKPLVKAVLG